MIKDEITGGGVAPAAGFREAGGTVRTGSLHGLELVNMKIEHGRRSAHPSAQTADFAPHQPCGRVNVRSKPGVTGAQERIEWCGKPYSFLSMGIKIPLA